MEAELMGCSGKVDRGKEGAPDYRYIELKFKVPVTSESSSLVGLVGTGMEIEITARQASFEEATPEALRDAAAVEV